MPEVDGRLMQQVMEDREVTQAHQREIFLEVLQAQVKDQGQAVAVQKLVDMGVRAGRAQTAQVAGKLLTVIHISQLRELKDIAKEAGVPWAKACVMFGFSSKTADLYLRQGAELGDNFVANMLAIGVPVRALEIARKLPENVRQRLTTGEVIDLETVSKEELTSVIKDLAGEHGKELAAKDQALADERKAKTKAEDKAKGLGERLTNLQTELGNLKAGLPVDDAEAIKIIQDIEKKILPLLAVYRHTTKMAGRSPEAVSRILASLELVKEVAEWTGNHLAAKAEGEEPDDEALGAGADMLAEDIAAHDGKRPVY
ncbi:MAG: hypothetical protein K9K65_06135 [Desulfarculaceae bacterium]|nr:hypothetical protein [Desulfarculaceae bacterium]MCF8097405.1 hypothetical protein [Desulfarculaceae bacterium]MCF8123829.1 hypothetical protein [Desulfarculaceae bacterium]